MADGTAAAAGTHGGERAVEALRFAEQFAVWTLRVWAAGHRGSEEAWSLLRDGFARAEAGPDGMAALADFMALVVLGRQRPLDVRCVHCPMTSPDEEAMLAALASAQARRPDLAFFALRGCLVPAAARLAVPHAERYAAALGEAGMALPGEAASRRARAEAAMRSSALH
ncbi:MAG: hypothetical protein JNL66_19215 [Alphaproteobacteria bacterium]|nr:hypothetical protein [Alphaproteobacteria bacterium]